MGLEKLRDFYFGVEDKWYSLIDKIDSKVPIHGLVDRIDKVFPSFVLFLIVIALIVVGLSLSLGGPAGAFISFKVTDSDGANVESASVNVYLEDEMIFSDKTDEDGETGQTSLLPDSKITVEVSKPDFQDYSEEIDVEKSMLLYGITLELIEEKTFNILLKDSVGQPIRQPVTLSFRCRNAAVQAPQDMTVSTGSSTVTEPANCNGLLVSVQGQGFQSVDSRELVQSPQPIYLQGQQTGAATINVQLYFNGQLVTENITVYLYVDNGTSSGIGPVESALSENGTATFSRQPGKYFVKTSGIGMFVASQSPVFTVAANDTKSVRIDLQQSPAGTVRVKIVDEATKQPVDGAKVLLRLGDEEIDMKVSSADDDALVEFPVFSDADYTVVVDHDDYCLKIVHEQTVGSAATEIKLKPFSSSCGAELKIKVLDQDGLPVKYATVGLYNESGFSIGFATKPSDTNGSVVFNRVPSGDYKAFAFKGSTSGWSDVDHFVQRTAEKTILTVVLVAGNGIVRVNVSDNEGTPLQFAQVAFIDALTHETIGGGSMPVEDVNGSVELNTRADKSLYVIVSNPEYTNFTSVVVPVVAGTAQTISAVLEKEIVQGDITVRFLGMYKNGNMVSVLAPGAEYDALFQLRVPANKSYDAIGLHVRAGSHETMELDKIVLKEINAPGMADILRATSFSQSNGYEADSQHLASEEAKWAELRWWRGFTTGLTHVSAKVKVKQTATINDQLDLFYRAWAEEGMSFKRHPFDEELGNAENVSGKQALYAYCNQEIFQVGTEQLCDEKFCFSASILDTREQLATSSVEGFSAGIFKQYKLLFDISNNSEHDTDSYIDAELRISNKDGLLLLQDYKVYGAQSQVRQGMVSGDSTGWIEIGNMLPKNHASGEIYFTPQRSGSSELLIEIRSGQMIRFSKPISIGISSDKEMAVAVSPEMLPSGVENTITVNVKDKETRAELDEALVKVKDRFGDVISETSTNSRGIATLRLPGLHPSEELYLFVGKPNYALFEQTLAVDPAVILVEPDSIGASLNGKTALDAQSLFSIENKTSFELRLKDIQLNGKLYGLADRTKSNNWLYSYVDDVIGPGEKKEMVLMTFLTEKGKRLEERKRLDASLDITTEAFGSEWTESVPVRVSIGVGGEVDDPSCFTVTRREWKASTEGNPVEIQFEIQNNCSVSGIPAELRNVSAKVDWQTNQVGTFSLRTEDNAIDVRSGYARKLAGILEAEESLPVVMTFSPNGGINGKGNATIVFTAENPTDSGPQELQNEIIAEITVINMVDCLAFSKDILIIKPEKSDSFDIETVGCGPRNEIRLESLLTLSTDRLTLGEREGRSIEVFAEKSLPGQYPIQVYAKGSDELQEKLVKTVRARILSDGCIELSKYEFDVFDDPDDPYDGYDTAQLINNCYDKGVTVTVEYDEKDWGEAMQDGLVWGLVGAIAGGLGSVVKGGGFWGGGGEMATTTNAVVGDGGDGGFGLGDVWEGITGVVTAPFKWLGGLFGSGATGFVAMSSTQSAEWDYDRPPSATGFASKVQDAATNSLVGSAANGLLGIGESILGNPNPLSWGLMGFGIGTIVSYMQQGEGEFDFTVVKEDLEYKNVKLFMPGATLEEDKLVEVESTDIIVKDLEEASTEPRDDAPNLSLEERNLGFLNVDSVTQSDPASPLYRVLKFNGERLEYKKNYKLEEEEKPTVKVKEREDYSERFRLQFNAFDPLAVAVVPGPLANCTLGTVVGKTGEKALPRVSFDWSWGEIEQDSCDEGNEDYIYCDATQFSIAVLAKVQQLRDFIEANKPFDCPSSGSVAGVKEQPLVITAHDVGLTKIQSSIVNGSDANITVIAESTNQKLMDAEVRIDVKQDNVLVDSCSRYFELFSKSIVSCQFAGLDDGEYDIFASITPVLCAECENGDTENDSIDATLVIGGTGMVECEPFNTKRLDKFLEASGYGAAQIEDVQQLITFNAHLMKDAYTEDFRDDFDLFCKTKSFFDCPVYYLEEDGLHRFFSDNERFEFDYSMAPHAPADAGKYAVTINIEFGNENWDFFASGQPDAKIIVEMIELSTPEPDSPFYYLPFDGLVGIDSDNGRQGYGINFRQTSEETIKINNALDQTLLSSPIASSTPVPNGWIDAGFSDDFVMLNELKRGILLDVQSGSGSTSMVLSPSYATPVMMQVDYETGRDAFAFYSVEIDNSPHSASTKLVPWTGIGVPCKDFHGNAMTEAWQDTWDLHGGISGNLSCAVGTGITDYGIEWCAPQRSGSVFLQSVVFTPQNRNTLMKRTAYSDGMSLFNAEEEGSQISLNGVPGMEFNSYGTNSIDSVEDVFELVRDSKVCIIGKGSRISNRFFWNPKVVLEEIAHQKSDAEESCIRVS